jgi:hypothetical protein
MSGLLLQDNFDDGRVDPESDPESVQCWLYVRVCSGTPSMNSSNHSQAPNLPDHVAKFGITNDIRAREALYSGDGGITAFCVRMPTRAFARGVEAFITDEFSGARAVMGCSRGRRREYLDMRAVSSMRAESYIEGDLHSRMAVANSLMRRAIAIARLSRPDLVVSEQDLVPWAAVCSDTSLIVVSEARPVPVRRAPRTPVRSVEEAVEEGVEEGMEDEWDEPRILACVRTLIDFTDNDNDFVRTFDVERVREASDSVRPISRRSVTRGMQSVERRVVSCKKRVRGVQARGYMRVRFADAQTTERPVEDEGSVASSVIEVSPAAT